MKSFPLADLPWVKVPGEPVATGLMADFMAFGDNMNRLYFAAACVLAVAAVWLALLPNRLGGLRWLGLLPAAGSVLLVINVGVQNQPSWLPLPILAAPTGVAFLAVWLAATGRSNS